MSMSSLKSFLPVIFLSLLVLLWMRILYTFFTRESLEKESTLPAIKTDMLPQIHKGSKIFTVPLFGISISDTEIKKSTLDVKLMSILYSTDAKHSQVIIKLANGEEKTYKVGDKILGRAIVKEVYPDKIIVLHHDTLESLYLPHEALQFIPSSPKRSK